MSPAPPTVAIVDDDEDVREALCELLEVMGFRCRNFCDGADLLAAYAPGRFDCIVTDIKMPRMNGLELLSELQALGSATPVIVLTSLSGEQMRHRSLEAGASAYLAKPVDDKTILDNLRVLLRHHPFLARGLGR